MPGEIERHILATQTKAKDRFIFHLLGNQNFTPVILVA